MENNVVLFEQHNVAVFEEIKKVIDKRKALEAEEAQMKAIIQKACEEYGIKSFKNDVVTISSIAEKTTVTVDLDKFKEEEPESYEDLMKDYPIPGIDLKALEAREPSIYQGLVKDYPKTKTTKAYVKFTWK